MAAAVVVGGRDGGGGWWSVVTIGVAKVIAGIGWRRRQRFTNKISNYLTSPNAPLRNQLKPWRLRLEAKAFIQNC
ncbi:hypothetical protein R6Q59_033422 [Mikania micrantha]|uniref:Uncharacterized protein n=1 Tax=Mikania micrantha TaxID=192012 RepID=A0A5N6NV09_9ASTR|nr:hypothetical protein E3N88_18056 [Mikania micrantha]